MNESEELAGVTIAPEERERIASACTEHADYLFGGQRLRLVSNDSKCITDFDAEFRDLRTVFESAAPGALVIACHMGGPPASLTFLVGDQVFRSSHPAILANCYATVSYLATVFNRTHYVVHAGCVARGSQALILSGASGLGKTTITTHLISRGMGFLSDERAPIDRKTGMVTPFPMNLGIRPGPAADLVRPLPGRDVAHGDDRKKMVDAGLINRRLLANPLPLHAVVFLTRTLSSDVSTARNFGGTIRVAFTSLSDDFRRDLLVETRSDELASETTDGCLFSILLRTRNQAGFLDALRDVARRHGVSIVRIQHENLGESDYDSEPQLMSIPSVAGVIELVKKIHPAQLGQMIRTEFGGRMPLMVEELSRLVRDARFYKLTPGRLSSMVEAKEALP
jgi:hypothetical protein